MRVRLERTVELEGARLRLRDWPGTRGPLVHVPDPLSPGDVLVETLAASSAADARVISVEPRAGYPYQIQAADLHATLAQFGFATPVLVGERLGCVAALLVAAWFPDAVSKLVLVDPTYAASPECTGSIEARALHDCPPDWPSVRTAVRCPILEIRWTNAALAVTNLQAFLRLP